MAWEGHYEYAGVEIINTSRTETYARNARLGWFKPVVNSEVLHVMLGENYTTPLQDAAPWTDPDDPASYDFFGLYPLSISGIENSTMSAPVTESTLDGGVVGRGRRATRAVVFSGVLIAASPCGAEYGMRWLRSALSGGPCISRAQAACSGADLCYLSCEPILDSTYIPSSSDPGYLIIDGGDADAPGPFPMDGGDAPTGGGTLIDGGPASLLSTVETTGDLEDCLDQYRRVLHSVSITTGPTLTAKMPMSDGAEAWSVQFTAVAGNPDEFASEVDLIRGFMDPTVEVPYVGGVVPEGGSFDPDGFVQTEVACPVTSYEPVFDPLCPAVVPPPPAPNVSLSCFSFPVNYRRRYFTIPAQNVPLWGDVVPVLSVHAPNGEVRRMRLRFYGDVSGNGDPNEDPCNYCGDIVFSYIPAGSTLVFDGTDKVVYVEDSLNGRRRADSLVFKSDGTPFEWPELSCGFGYTVTIDLPQSGNLPVVDLNLVPRIR